MHTRVAWGGSTKAAGRFILSARRELQGGRTPYCTSNYDITRGSKLTFPSPGSCEDGCGHLLAVSRRIGPVLDEKSGG